MSDNFSFDNIKVTVAKANEVPAIVKPRSVATNPFAETFLRSTEKLDEDGNGRWLNMIVPGSATVNDKGATNYGPIATKALNYLRGAAKDAGYGTGLRVSDMEDGNVKIFFRAQPRRTVNRNKTDEATASE